MNVETFVNEPSTTPSSCPDDQHFEIARHDGIGVTNSFLNMPETRQGAHHCPDTMDKAAVARLAKVDGPGPVETGNGLFAAPKADNRDARATGMQHAHPTHDRSVTEVVDKIRQMTFVGHDRRLISIRETPLVPVQRVQRALSR
jgi:hypothetical protein